MKPIKIINRYLALLEKKKELDIEIEAARNQTMDEMQRIGVKQLKTDDATVTIAKRVTESVNETGFRIWASEQPDFESDIFYINMLDTKKVKDFSKKHLMETGEIVPYITASETEYLTVRAAKSE